MKRVFNLKVRTVVVALSAAMVFSCSCSMKSSKDDNSAELKEVKENNKDLEKSNNDLKSQLKEAQADLEEAQANYEVAQANYEEAQTNYEKASSDLDKSRSECSQVSSQYESYRAEMSEYEGLAADEKKAREIEASKAIESEAEEKRKQEEAAASESEEKEKQGYDTGITYDQLARTPDDYEGEKVKFKGKVIQVLEGDGSVTLRVAVNSDYDKILLVTYESGIVSSRVLEDDIITIYGISGGLYTYDSTMGGKITIPLIYVEKIDQ